MNGCGKLEFADKLRQLDALAGTLEDTSSGGDNDDDNKKKPTGRRDPRKLPLEEERIEIHPRSA